MAVAMTVALPVLAAPDPDTAAAHLRWLIEVAYQRRRATATHLKHNWGDPGPILSTLFDEGFNDVAEYSRGLRPSRPQAHQHQPAQAARHVPQLAWADLYDSHFGPLLNHTLARAGRAITAICITKALEHSTWPRAAQTLGLDTAVGRVASAVTKRLEHDGRLDAFSQGIRTVVSILDDHADRIDFSQRRHLLDDPRILQPYINQSLDAPLGLIADHRQNERLTAMWLWATITGGYPRHTTGWARLQRHERRTYPRFCVTDAITLAATLNHAGAKLLAEHGPPDPSTQRQSSLRAPHPQPCPSHTPAPASSAKPDLTTGPYPLSDSAETPLSSSWKPRHPSRSTPRPTLNKLGEPTRQVAGNARRGLCRAGAEASRKARAALAELETVIERLERIVDQTRLRLGGDTPEGASRLVSLHDPDARPVKKGRLGKPVEFGYLAQIMDNVDGIVLDHGVHVGNPPDGPLLAPAVERITKQVGRAPKAVTADRGYGEAKVQQDLETLGVKQVAIVRKGRQSAARQAIERRPAFAS
jgi:hypothetical protein